MGKDKIKFKEKLAYATVNFGNIPIMTIINGYLLIFYTNICVIKSGGMCHIVPDCKNPGWIK